MKKIVLTIMACLGLFMTGHAQITDVKLGYCAGELPKSGSVRYSEPDSWVSGAIYIPASTLNTFAGNQINGINAALASKLNVEQLTVWLRSDLDGENLVEKTITTDSDPKIVKWWNELKFDTPWDIPANSEKGIYIGYSFYQKKTTYGLATLPTSVKNGFFAKVGDGPWSDRSSEGTLCVEALVSGEYLPKVNLALVSLEVPDVYIIDRGTMQIGGTVQNLATYTITGYDVNAFVGGVKVGTVHVDSDIKYGETARFSVSLPLGIVSIGDGTGNVTITIDNINEGTDEDETDNSLSSGFKIVQHDFHRRIFVEEFTTEKCPNCPRVGTYIHDSLEKEEFKDDVIVVCHHAGYDIDWLTTYFDADYLWLYNDKGTYAPAMAVDRTAHDDHTSVWCPTSSGDMESAWRKALNEPAFVSLNMSAEVDENDENHVTVTVKGAKSIESLGDNTKITVFVVEDNIPAKSQAGAAGTYIHQHVNRAVNSIWGDELSFNGDEYEYSCEFNLSTFWERENLQFVAIISNYNSDNAIDCSVHNASNLPFSDVVSGIGSIETDETAEVEIYTISGVRITGGELAPGMYIRKTGAKTERFIVR